LKRLRKIIESCMKKVSGVNCLKDLLAQFLTDQSIQSIVENLYVRRI